MERGENVLGEALNPLCDTEGMHCTLYTCHSLIASLHKPATLKMEGILTRLYQYCPCRNSFQRSQGEVYSSCSQHYRLVLPHHLIGAITESMRGWEEGFESSIQYIYDTLLVAFTCLSHPPPPQTKRSFSLGGCC